MNSDGAEDIDFDRAAQDCTNVAEAEVDFSSYYGLNLMFNGELDAAFGVTTGVSLTLDGITKIWPSVFIDNKGGYNMALTAHEMYHGFGLGHSAVRNPDGTVFSGSSWDPVGIGACGFNSCTPSHIPAPQKDELGWIGADKTYTATLDSQTITLEALALPQTDNYLMAKILLADNHFYTLEARRQAGYDQKVPGSTVLIHEVNLIPGAFSNGHIGLIPEPGQAEPWGTGAMWTVGEMFTDVTNGITVSVLAATATGFEVQIEKRPIENQAPNTPGNPSPADGASSVPLTPTLTWSGGDPDSPVVTYTVAFGTDDPPAVVSATTTTTYKPPLDLLENTQYYWRITASDGSLSSAGPIWTFTTTSTASSHTIYLPVVLK